MHTNAFLSKCRALSKSMRGHSAYTFAKSPYSSELPFLCGQDAVPDQDPGIDMDAAQDDTHVSARGPDPVCVSQALHQGAVDNL
jgi:hypothetical protein